MVGADQKCANLPCVCAPMSDTNSTLVPNVISKCQQPALPVCSTLALCMCACHGVRRD